MRLQIRWADRFGRLPGWWLRQGRLWKRFERRHRRSTPRVSRATAIRSCSCLWDRLLPRPWIARLEFLAQTHGTEAADEEWTSLLAAHRLSARELCAS